MTTITVSSTGRITIPAALRRQLGIVPGSRLYVEVRDDEIILRRIKTVAELKGILADRAIPGMTWEQEREAAERSIAEEAMEGM